MLIIFALLSVVPAWLMRGWVLFKLWGWFAVPLLHVPAIPVLGAVGLFMIVSMMTDHPHVNPYEKLSTEDKVGKLVGSIFFDPLWALFFGWVFHLWMVS